MTLETIALFLGRIDHPLKKLIKKKCRITFFWGPPNPQNKVSLLIIIKKKKIPPQLCTYYKTYITPKHNVYYNHTYIKRTNTTTVIPKS